MSSKESLQKKLKENQKTLDVFATEQLILAWQQKTGKDLAEEFTEAARWAANYASAVLDANVVRKMISDLGVTGEVVLKTVNGKQYVIFKGYAGPRSIFTACRYLGSNPKVVDMAIGRLGVNASIASGARLTIFLVIPLNILKYILSDQQTMSRLIGTTATDIVKVGAASAIAALAGTVAGTLTTLAVGPLIVVIVIGIGVGYGLDLLDKKFGITEALIRELDKMHDATIGEFGRQINIVEKRLKWQIENGRSVGQGIFY